MMVWTIQVVRVLSGTVSHLLDQRSIVCVDFSLFHTMPNMWLHEPLKMRKHTTTKGKRKASRKGAVAMVVSQVPSPLQVCIRLHFSSSQTLGVHVLELVTKMIFIQHQLRAQGFKRRILCGEYTSRVQVLCGTPHLHAQWSIFYGNLFILHTILNMWLHKRHAAHLVCFWYTV